MADIDGSHYTSEGEKFFVSARPGESSEDFCERAFAMLSEVGHPFADDPAEGSSGDPAD